MVCVPDLLRSVCQLFALVLCPPVESVPLRLLCLHHCWLDHDMSVGCGALPARLNLLLLHRMIPHPPSGWDQTYILTPPPTPIPHLLRSEQSNRKLAMQLCPSDKADCITHHWPF